MKIKKNPKANLENYSGVFTLLGLVLTLFVSYVVIEHKSYAATKPPVKYTPTNYVDETTVNIHLPTPKQETPKTEEPIIEPLPEPEPIKQKPIADIDPNHLKKVEDATTVLDKVVAITDYKDKSPDGIENIKSIQEDEAEVVDNISYMSIQNAPVFPGCEKYTNDKVKSKKCFSKKIAKFFSRNFDTDLASELDLHGVQSIRASFIIDTHGEVKPDIKTSKTHPKIAEEIKKVLKDLPKMKPATQNGKKVNLVYSLPVKFRVE